MTNDKASQPLPPSSPLKVCEACHIRCLLRPIDTGPAATGPSLVPGSLVGHLKSLFSPPFSSFQNPDLSRDQASETLP